MAVYRLENADIRIDVKTAGAELISLVDRASGREYMWCGDGAYWARVSPVLFPIVGQYKDKTSFYDGKAYSMGQHGFARDMEFTLESRTEDEIWFTLASSPESHEKYPFDFLLSCGYRLEGRSVHMMWKVRNTDERTMYFSIGAHPAFNCPMDGTWKLRFDTDAPLTVGILENGVLSERQKTLTLDNGTYPVTNDLFDDDALIIENDQAHNVAILDQDGKTVVEVDFQSHLFGVWSPVKKKAPFVCIEPWYGRSDRADFDQQLEHREHGNVLAPGGEFEAEYLITV